MNLTNADILIVSNYFHPEPAGSAPPITDLARWLAENGAEPRVLTARPSYPGGKVFDGYDKGERDLENWHGITIRRLSSHTSADRGLFGRFLSEASYGLALAAARLQGYPRTRHLLSVCPTIIAVLIAGWFRQADARHLVIVHDIQSGLGAAVLNGGIAMSALRKVERLALNRADVIVTLSEGMATQIRALGVKRPIEVLPPQIDAREITVLPEPETSTPLVLYSGALGRKQGLEQVIDACAHLSKAHVNARIVIRGQGGIQDQLRSRAEMLQLSNLAFEPLVSRDQLNHAMAEAAIHLVPQIADGQDFALPSKVFSIMASGRPFVGTATPESPLGLLASRSCGGVVTPPADTKAFARAIEELLRDRQKRLRMGIAARKYVEQHADRDVICRRIAALLFAPEAG